MNNVTEIACPADSGRARRRAVATERESESTRRGLIAHPEALRAVLKTAGALQRTPDAVPARDVTAFGGPH